MKKQYSKPITFSVRYGLYDDILNDIQIGPVNNSPHNDYINVGGETSGDADVKSESHVSGGAWGGDW